MIIDEVMKFKFKMMTTFRWNKKMTGFVFAQHGFKHVCYVFRSENRERKKANKQTKS